MQENDIAYFNFCDTYRNLTIKTLVAFNYALEQYNSSYFFKTDDDMFVNIKRIAQLLKDYKINNIDNILFGHCIKNPFVDRRVHSKHYVSFDNFPHKRYSPYCTGAGYILSKTALNLVLKVNSNVTLVPSEDTSIGILANLARLKIENIHKWVGNGTGYVRGICPDVYVNHGYHPDSMIDQFNICEKKKS